MAKKIIVLERMQAPPGVVAFRYALWADVPATRQNFYANADAKSAYKDASTFELQALQAGQVAERVGEGRWPQGTTVTQIKAFLVSAFNDWQSEVNGRNDWDRYGTFFDGAAWTDAGVQ
jgi:hypothetical protein